MSYVPHRARAKSGSERTPIDPSQLSENPTVHLEPGGRPGLGDAAPPLDADISPDDWPLRMATEDLWAVSSSHGEWRDRSPQSQSDFLVMEPPATTIAGEDAAPDVMAISRITKNAHGTAPRLSAPLETMPASSSVHGMGYDDPLQHLAIHIQFAIEHHLAQQGTALPLPRTPENVELVRRMTRNYLRHDPAAAEIAAGTAETERLLASVVEETLGFGPLDPLLRDESVSEIMVTGPQMTFVEQGGRLHEVPVHFMDDAHLLRVIQKLIQPIGVTVDADQPFAHCRLADGTAVTVVIPPAAITGPSLTLRRFSRRALSLEQLVRMDALSLHVADFLRMCVTAHLNILICGISGSGKTTLLNALASTIDDHERIVTIEDVAELQLHQRHLVRLESTPPARLAPADVSTSALLAHTLHMRPERIILGECQGSEALTLAQAMNSGFDGILTTLYANSPRDALARFEALCLSAGSSISSPAVRQLIATGVDLILFCARLRDGTRRVVSVTDVPGMEGDAIATQDLFVFREAGLDMTTGRIRGEFATTGTRPSFAARIEDGQSPPYLPFGARGA
jgi:pilus assembly protein CpaF